MVTVKDMGSTKSVAVHESKIEVIYDEAADRGVYMSSGTLSWEHRDLMVALRQLYGLRDDQRINSIVITKEGIDARIGRKT